MRNYIERGSARSTSRKDAPQVSFSTFLIYFASLAYKCLRVNGTLFAELLLFVLYCFLLSHVQSGETAHAIVHVREKMRLLQLSRVQVRFNNVLLTVFTPFLSLFLTRFQSNTIFAACSNCRPLISL